MNIILARQYRKPGLWGFAFDTRARLALQLGLSDRTPSIVATFGTEPIAMPPERAVSIIEAVIHGRVRLQYRTLAGWLMRTAGTVEVPGAPERFYGPDAPIGRRWTFHYAPWVSSELD